MSDFIVDKLAPGPSVGDKEKALDQIRCIGPPEGSIWEHYKGGRYVVIACALSEDTLQPYVVYRSFKDGVVWTRSFDSWFSTVKQADDSSLLRFRQIFP